MAAAVEDSAGAVEDISTAAEDVSAPAVEEEASAPVEETIAPSVVELAPAPGDVAPAGVVAWSEHTPDIQFRPSAHFPSLLPQDPPKAILSIYWQYQSTGVVKVSPGVR